MSDPNQGNNITATVDNEGDTYENLVFLNHDLRLVGLGVMSACLIVASSLAAWVYGHRKAPVVQAMQPVFLIMLCVGNGITNFTILPMSMDASIASTRGLDAACQSLPWLNSIGRTLILSALFSKLWRVNQIFHAQGFQRKVVTAKEMMWPIVILLSLNLCTVLTANLIDPRHWVQEPIYADDEEEITTSTPVVGYCTYDTWVGKSLDIFRACVNFGALIILCVQAYRARDIRSDFSEARGVALALFCNAQAVIVAWPTLWLMEETNVNARFLLEVLLELTTSLPMLLFIMGPVIAHHQQYRKRQCTRISLVGNVPRVSGVATTTNATTGGNIGTTTLSSAVSDDGQEYPLGLASLDLIAARIRITDLEAKVKELNNCISDLKGPECRRE